MKARDVRDVREVRYSILLFITTPFLSFSTFTIHEARTRKEKVIASNMESRTSRTSRTVFRQFTEVGRGNPYRFLIIGKGKTRAFQVV